MVGYGWGRVGMEWGGLGMEWGGYVYNIWKIHDHHQFVSRASMQNSLKQQELNRRLDILLKNIQEVKQIIQFRSDIRALCSNLQKTKIRS